MIAIECLNSCNGCEYYKDSCNHPNKIDITAIDKEITELKACVKRLKYLINEDKSAMTEYVFDEFNEILKKYNQ